MIHLISQYSKGNTKHELRAGFGENYFYVIGYDYVPVSFVGFVGGATLFICDFRVLW